MKKLLPVLPLVLSALGLGSAFAAGRSEEIVPPAPTRILEFTAEAIGGVAGNKPKDSESTTTIGARFGANYFVTPQLELGVNFEYFHYTNSEISGHSEIYLLGPTYNFCEDAENSPFLGALVGEETTGAHTTYAGTVYTNSTAQFTYQLNAGKRFHVADHVSWAPEVSYTYTGEDLTPNYTAHSVTDWKIIPLRFSVLL